MKNLCYAGVVVAGLIALSPAFGLTTYIGRELEPNNTPVEATPLLFDDVKVTGDIFPIGDVDYYKFNALAGDRIYAAVMSSWTASGFTDSELRIMAPDGVTEIEYDNDDGSFGGTSSSIAGCVIPASGVYYVRVNHFSATGQLRPYDLWFRLRRGSPAVEAEPNDTLPGQALSPTGWVSGVISNNTEIDMYSVNLNAGDTVFLSLDLNPVRGSNAWNGRLNFGVFGSFFLAVNDASAVASNSEAMFMTVKEAGTYTVMVDSTVGATNHPYRLSVSVLPTSPAPSTVYTSADVPKAIPDATVITSTLLIPQDKRIGKLRVHLNLTHQNPPDIDMTLTAPGGNIVLLIEDIGGSSQTNWNIVLDDDAGIPVGTFLVNTGLVFRTDLDGSLAWFKGQRTQGTWTLTVADDTTNSLVGVLKSWSLEVIEPPPLAFGPTTEIFRADFEANNGGFTVGGSGVEWEWGLPVFDPIASANGGIRCWVTDLDDTYNATTINDLYSPSIDLAAYAPGTPIFLEWAMKHHLESASFDTAFVDVQDLTTGVYVRRVWQWTGATQNQNLGPAATLVNMAAGWGVHRALISDFAGRTIRVRFNLTADATVQLGGLAIDDVSVLAMPGMVRSTNNLAMNFYGLPGRPYKIQNTTNLVSGVWVDVAPKALFTAPDTQAFTFILTNPVSPYAHFRSVANP